MDKGIAFFDFDGTITRKDTLLEFIRFSQGWLNFCIGFFLTSPWILAYKLKLISNQRAKEKVLAYFFKDYPISRFQQQCDLFSVDVLPGLIRPKALQEIERLKRKGTSIVIVSASPENWIREWAGQVHAALIATRLETRSPLDREKPIGESRLTGKIEGVNCYGLEKVRRIREAYSLADYTEIRAYGDSSGDKPMLQLGTVAFYKPFQKKRIP